MSNEPFTVSDYADLNDLILRCADCGQQFIFTVGEQIYFSDKKLSLPKRCPTCRKTRKESLRRRWDNA